MAWMYKFYPYPQRVGIFHWALASVWFRPAGEEREFGYSFGGVP
jgi:hypothetical protein